MTSEGGTPDGDRLGDITREATEYYDFLKQKHSNQTRLDVALTSVVVWFAVFAVLGLGAITTEPRPTVLAYLIGAFVVAVVAGAASGLAMYASRRKRGFKFAQIGEMLAKMKQGGVVSSEDGLRLMDAMHQAALVVKKRGMDSAFEYGIVAFIVVAIVGENAAVAALAGVVAYIYFRHEALQEYEKEEKKYDDSKKELLQTL